MEKDNQSSLWRKLYGGLYSNYNATNVVYFGILNEDDTITYIPISNAGSVYINDRIYLFGGVSNTKDIFMGIVNNTDNTVTFTKLEIKTPFDISTCNCILYKNYIYIMSYNNSKVIVFRVNEDHSLDLIQ